ncbi:hypothetical protein BH721_14500 [Clostridium baratii]|uniref:hypothetical protein n=1 Tax=Clostridium baratii TaxID=1561 RepID=UPI0009A296DA|nr:hypothetical protein [Clostridium baratii]OPF52047.1 hypothetical protein A1M12_14450 [Clostridium baratii]OPF54668.1 hypothetical protein BH721_14500 [Clostridium baratii]OPF54682.1 hypothetical protein BH724_14055 [Clostridium baratii]OPF60945.1 hypothetical protein BH725_14720 [Clostridium baratii]
MTNILDINTKPKYFKVNPVYLGIDYESGILTLKELFDLNIDCLPTFKILSEEDKLSKNLSDSSLYIECFFNGKSVYREVNDNIIDLLNDLLLECCGYAKLYPKWIPKFYIEEFFNIEEKDDVSVTFIDSQSGSRTARVLIPTDWIYKLGITKDTDKKERKVKLRFDGTKITILKSIK